MNLHKGLELAAKVLTKTMDTATPNADKLEFGVVEKTESGVVRVRMISKEEVNKLMQDAAPKEDAPAASST